MLKILLPVDGSPSAVRATQTLIDTLGWYREAPSLDVVSVHLPVPQRAQHGIVRQQGDDPESITTTNARRCSRPSRSLLEAAGVACKFHSLTGPSPKPS